MKELLIKCFNDTFDISNSILSAETTNAINSNKVYKENFISDKREDKCIADIKVEEDTSLNAARKYAQFGKVAVLNFANPHFPGGGVKKGAKAQEECLCRSSNLYLCLSAKNVYDDYYLYNRNIKNRFFSDRLIYTKNVTVFKDDSDVPQPMPKSEWFQVDVITCAAPYIANRKYINKTVLKELFKSRIKNIFESAIDNNVDVLVLGAFGCGAFKNPPAVVAKAFHEVIEENNYKNCFKHILFAIKRGKNYNVDAFMKEFDIPGLTINCPDFILPEIKLPNGNTINAVEVSTHKAYAYIDSDDIKDCIANGDDSFVRDSLFECDYEKQCKFIRWQYHNKYFNKQFSILGDSISTLAGYNPKGYKVFFDEKSGERSGIHNMNDTWWGKVIDFFGGELLVNNSWSGSRVTSSSTTLFPSGCSDERTSCLHINSINPDVIIIYLGFNDWANGVALGGTHILEESLDYYYFASAYNKMLENIISNYQNAEIWCCTLNTTFMSTNPTFKFPYMHGGIHIEEYNHEIKQAANNHNCKIIDLYKYNTPYDTIDGSHPNADGMNTLATLVIREIGGKEVKQFMDIENEKDENNFCLYCGKTIKAGSNFCQYCGKSLNGNPEFNICPNCSQRTLKHSTSSDYCTNCGFEMLFYNDNPYIYDSNAEYVRLPSDITRWLFDNILKLYDVNTSQNIEIRNGKIDAGRSSDCELQIGNNYISQIHASFYHEDSCWFVMDKNSMNGTWLNGEKLIQNTKYELYPGDVINFAKAKEYVFYKPIDDDPHEYSENELLGFLEEAIVNFYADNDDTDALELIGLTMAEVPIYFPMDYDFNEMSGNIDPQQLKKWEIITNFKDVRMKIITLQVGDEEIVPMFTSSEQAHKGSAVNITRLYPQDYLPIVISMNKSFVLNPFANNAVSLKVEFLKDFVLPLVQEKLKGANEINNENHDDIKEGTVLDNRYELLKQIGSGGLSTVYLARNIRLNKACAVKVVEAERNNQSNPIFNSTIQEAQMMKSLTHPAIPNIIDIVECQNFVAIVMDYVEGEILESIVKENGALSIDSVIDLSIQLCDFLEYLHSFNPPYIYRDMKPANIIVKPGMRIAVVDFGIMRTYKSGKTADTVCLGTSGFAPPEQYGTDQTDQRSDIYSLGMTMYNICFGVSPKGKNYQITDEAKTSLDAQFLAVIKKCTELNPNDRYGSCAELKNDLNSLKEKFGLLNG